MFYFVRLLRQAASFRRSCNFLCWRPYVPLESRLFLASSFGLDLSFSISHTYVPLLLWLVYDLCIMDTAFVSESCRQDCRWKECQITIKLCCTSSCFVFVCIISLWVNLFRCSWNFGKTPWKNLVPEDTHSLLVPYFLNKMLWPWVQTLLKAGSQLAETLHGRCSYTLGDNIKICRKLIRWDSVEWNLVVGI
jgi:hypothetical protein